jgi:uncharacterized protein (TIGR01777 family)
MRQTIIVAGGSGFIGGELRRLLSDKGYEVVCLTRGKDRARMLENQGFQAALWDGCSLTGWENELEEADAVINLAGENIGSGRWTAQKKNKILDSRVNAGKILVEAIRKVKHKPGVLVQASAVGFYGDRGDESLDEESGPGGGFLADVVKQWEDSSSAVEELGVRRVVCRFGLVLGKDGGALKRMTMPFRFFAGGPMGAGSQWMSWVHVEDAVRAAEYLMTHDRCGGVYNITAPYPVRNSEMAACLGRWLHRPSWLPVPRVILKAALGEMADGLLLSGQRVLSKRLLEDGFSFLHPKLDQALRHL